MVWWLRLHTSTAGGIGSIPGQGNMIPHAMLCGQKKKKEDGKDGEALGGTRFEVAGGIKGLGM